jgi:hypothetical protein
MYISNKKGGVMMKSELNPNYSNRKSFYGKAHIIEEEGRKTLRSYQTNVAYIEGGKAFVKRLYSPTTTNHIFEFLRQNGFKVKTGDQVLKDYPCEKVEETQEEAGSGLGGMMKMLTMISAVGQITTEDIKERNEWDLRMIKASGLPLSIPEDFDTLPEKEKRRRLDGIMKIMAEDQKAVA